MIVRWATEQDDPEVIGQLSTFNDNWKTWMTAQYKSYRPLLPNNLIVAEENNELIGVLHVFDCGLPWTILDAWYMKPEVRSFRNALYMANEAIKLLQKRGIQMIQINAPAKLSKALQRGGCRLVGNMDMLIKVIYAGD